jgi:D-3-phosphoglycerate dehydrogenase
LVREDLSTGSLLRLLPGWELEEMAVCLVWPDGAVRRRLTGLLVDFLATGAIRHAVNAAPIDPAALEGVRGFLDLAWRLGVLLSQLEDGAPRSCSIAYRGEIAARNTRLVTAAFAAGLLESAIEDVNIVNAEMLLRERGIELVEQSRTDPGGHHARLQPTTA